MARLFPRRSSTSRGDRSPRVVDLADEDADDVFGALSSTTARQIYAALDEQPRTPSDVAEAIDSSIQNVRYHLEKLEDAGLIEVVDTWYSSRGNEMSVYATANGPLIVTNDRSTADRVKSILSRYLGGLAALLGMSLLVQYGLAGLIGPDDTDAAPTETDDDDGDAGDGTAADTEDGPAADDTENGPATDDTEDGPAGEEVEDEGDALQIAEDDEDASDAPADDSTTGDEASDSIADDAGATDAVAPPEGGETVAEIVFGTVPPGMVFFLGGAVVLTAVTLYWYWRAY